MMSDSELLERLLQDLFRFASCSWCHSEMTFLEISSQSLLIQLPSTTNLDLNLSTTKAPSPSSMVFTTLMK